MGLLEYNANNSGGSWWLSDEDWKALEEAGWNVEWRKDMKDGILSTSEDGRWLGALATAASKEFKDAGEGIEEFERVAKQCASDGGCPCCGPPHSFSFTDDEGNHHYHSVDYVAEAGWS